MANGKKGDDPLIDILKWGSPVFTPEIDDLIRELRDQNGLESPLAIEYVRLIPDLLYWVAEVERLSGRDREDVRAHLLDEFRDTLNRALGRPSAIDRIQDTTNGRTYSRAELVSLLRDLETDEVRAAESALGALEDQDVFDLLRLYLEVTSSGPPD